MENERTQQQCRVENNRALSTLSLWACNESLELDFDHRFPVRFSAVFCLKFAFFFLKFYCWCFSLFSRFDCEQNLFHDFSIFFYCPTKFLRNAQIDMQMNLRIVIKILNWNLLNSSFFLSLSSISFIPYTWRWWWNLHNLPYRTIWCRLKKKLSHQHCWIEAKKNSIFKCKFQYFSHDV